MAEPQNIQTPGLNQPIDYDFISTIITQINNLVDAYKLNSTSGISHNILNNAIAANNLSIIGIKKSISASTVTDGQPGTPVPVEFPKAFGSTPIVMVTPQVDNTNLFAKFDFFVSNVTTRGCTINLIWRETTSKSIAINFDVLAIGSSQNIL